MATKPKTKPATTGGASTSITFAFVTETKGALRFQEIDDKGAPLELDVARIGTLYVRKARFGELSATWASEGAPPKRLTVTVSE